MRLVSFPDLYALIGYNARVFGVSHYDDYFDKQLVNIKKLYETLVTKRKWIHVSIDFYAIKSNSC